MSTLQLQPGKWYRQRDGGKAYVAAELPEEVVMQIDFRFIGVDNEKYSRRWDREGVALNDCDSYDLVAEWVDEPTDAEIAEAVRWSAENGVWMHHAVGAYTQRAWSARELVDAVNEYRAAQGK